MNGFLWDKGPESLGSYLEDAHLVGEVVTDFGPGMAWSPSGSDFGEHSGGCKPHEPSPEWLQRVLVVVGREVLMTRPGGTAIWFCVAPSNTRFQGLTRS